MESAGRRDPALLEVRARLAGRIYGAIFYVAAYSRGLCRDEPAKSSSASFAKRHVSSYWSSKPVTGLLIGLWTNLLVARWIQKTHLSDRLLVRRDETFERHDDTACRLFGDLEFTPGFETDVQKSS